MGALDWLFAVLIIGSIVGAIWASYDISKEAKKGNYRIKVWVSHKELAALQKMRDEEAEKNEP